MALITGDLVNEQAMRAALPPLPRTFIVRGNMDFSGSEYNFSEQIHVGGFRFLLLHGTQLRPRGNVQQLYDIAEHVEADVAVHGHTHEAAIELYKDKLILNPGTISGATGGWSGKTTASMIDLTVRGWSIEVTLFKTDWKKVSESKALFEKRDGIIKRKQE